jgi:hypothetical protein
MTKLEYRVSLLQDYIEAVRDTLAIPNLYVRITINSTSTSLEIINETLCLRRLVCALKNVG